MKQKFVLINEQVKQNAMGFISALPTDGKPYYIEVKPETRRLRQNAIMWVLLGKLSRHVKQPVSDSDGFIVDEYLSAEEWKQILSASLEGLTRRCEDPNGNGYILLGHSTSTETVTWMTDMIELIYAFAAQRGVNLDEL